MTRLASRSLFALGLFTLGFAAACSSAPAPPNDLDRDDDGSNEQNATKKPTKSTPAKPPSNDGDQDEGTGPTPAGSSNDGGTPPSGNPPPANAGKCAGEASADACFSCCEAGNEAGIQAVWQVFDACVCQNPGTCASACGNNYCAGGQPSQACEQCLDGATQCQQQSDQACAANASCKAANDCIEASKCDDKQ